MTKETKKEEERNELHKTIWQIATDLRGSVDSWDFKQYVLGMLFYRFISENLTNYINNEQYKAGFKDFDYTKLADEKAESGKKVIIKEKGFYILPSELFENVLKNAHNNPDINETLEKNLKNIERSAIGTESEEQIKGLFDDLDVNSNKLGDTVTKRNKKLIQLMETVKSLNIGDYNQHSIDAFGDTYEFLMAMYASNAGKSGGEFFTPQEVSEVLAEIAVADKTEINKVYDPACGSGSLLLKFAKILSKDKVRQGFFGQEINITTYNLCRINMFLHNINYEKFDIKCGDTLTSPKHSGSELFDAIVSNPPYSIRWEGDSNPVLINDSRFSPAGVLAPKGKADLAFTMHILSHLSDIGTAAIVQFPGVLYRGGAEQKIREYLINNNYIDAVIQLSPDLFFGTNIATCIMVLKKNKKSNDILFINALNEFTRLGNKNKLSKENIKKIVDTYKNRNNIENFAKLVDIKKIAQNDYNIAVNTYIEQKNTGEETNILELNKEISNTVKIQKKLKTDINKIITELGE